MLLHVMLNGLRTWSRDQDLFIILSENVNDNCATKFVNLRKMVMVQNFKKKKKIIIEIIS